MLRTTLIVFYKRHLIRNTSELLWIFKRQRQCGLTSKIKTGNKHEFELGGRQVDKIRDK